MPPATKRVRVIGIGLIELLCVLAIVAITTTFAAVQLQTMSRIQAMRAKTGSFEASARFARDQAISLGTRVSICRTQDGSSCASSSRAKSEVEARDWASGWLVFTDSDPRGEVNDDDRVLLAEGVWTKGRVLQSERTGKYVLSYRASGAGVASSMSFTVSPNPVSSKAGSSLSETICVNMTGQVRHQAGVC